MSAKRISKKRMEEIRAGVADYVEKLERGEISTETKPAGIGFAGGRSMTVKEAAQADEIIIYPDEMPRSGYEVMSWKDARPLVDAWRESHPSRGLKALPLDLADDHLVGIALVQPPVQPPSEKRDRESEAKD